MCYTLYMRTTLNISMPKTQKSIVDKMVKDYNYASFSELFRDALRALQDSILVRDMMESEREFAEGKGKRLKSLKDLM